MKSKKCLKYPELIIKEQSRLSRSQGFGWQGKHITMTNGKRIITIPRANPINAFTMGGIVKYAGLTVEEFKNLL